MKIATYPHMRYILILIMTALLLSSCSPKPKPNPTSISNSSSKPASSIRKQVFTQNKASSSSKLIKLTFASEPVQLEQGFIRLAGIVESDNNGRSALLELGGKGISCIRGEVFENKYRVVQIRKKEVVIINEK